MEKFCQGNKHDLENEKSNFDEVEGKRKRTDVNENGLSDNEENESEQDDEEDEEIYEGQVNNNGEPHGRGTLYFDELRTTSFQGRFVNGVKEGRGSFHFADGSSLKGLFVNDSLEGEGMYIYEDNSFMVATYKDGELNGPAKEYDSNERLVFDGYYDNNIRTGVCHFYIEYGGHLFGCVDKEGKLSGKDVVYSYQDEQTFLKGTFKDGKMVSARVAMYDGIGDKRNPHSYKKVKDSFVYSEDISTCTKISTFPFQKDPYEEKRVCVKPSNIIDAGEGLFSVKAAQPGEVMSFYNGIRVTHEEVDGRDWKHNDNTISLNDQIVIDVPANLSSVICYCASLGHKANHSFKPNSKYDRFNHPRFGEIKCIRTIEHVEPGDELTVAYGYDHTKLETDAPEWYKKKLSEWMNIGSK